MDPAFEFAIGWNLVYGNLLSIPSEITAICVLFEFWTDLTPAIWIVIFMVLTVLIGVAFIRGKSHGLLSPVLSAFSKRCLMN